MIPDFEDLSDEEKVDMRQFNGQSDVGASLSGWTELYLKEEIQKAIREAGFEYPSEVQKAAIPAIMTGKDVLCQARAGMGKTAVYIIGVLNQLEALEQEYKPFTTLLICPTRELAHQAFKDFRRLSRYFKEPLLKINCFFGGMPINNHREMLQNIDEFPTIIIGTPGRLESLSKDRFLPLDKIDTFIVDECDQILSNEMMRRDLKSMFQRMPVNKQVVMLSATMSPNSVKYAKSFMRENELEEIYIDPGKLIIPGLTQYNINLVEANKFKTLIDIIDKVNFNQGIIFVNRIERVKKLTNLLKSKLCNPICIHSNLTQEERIINYDNFKANKSKILVATDLFGRGIDIERVNLVINYDLPEKTETYFHRIGRAGRFNTIGVAINFVCKIGDEDQEFVWRKDIEILKEIEGFLANSIPELPENFSSSLIS